VSPVGIIWRLVEVGGLVDALRRPHWQWSFGDRNRAFWVVFMFFLGPIFVLPYSVAVRPHFPGPADQLDQAFRKA
jgi:hypothetical protein